VIVDVRQVPLVRTALVLQALAFMQTCIVFIPLSTVVSEALVHGNMGNHVLVMGVAVAIADLRRGVVGKGSVAHTRTAEVEHAQRRDTGIDEVQSRQGGHGRTERVATHHDSVGRELGLQSLDGSDDIGNDALFGVVEALVHLAIIALAVGGGERIQVVQPIPD